MEKIKILYQLAQQKNEQLIDENVRLRKILDGQREIIHELSESYNFEEWMEQTKINEEMEENLNSSIASSSAYLQSLLETPKQKKNQASDILKSILNDIQGQFMELCRICTDKGMLEVPITAIVDIEQQLNSFEDRLEENNHFPEKEEDKNQRKLIRNFHYQKVMDFLGEVLHKKSDSDSHEEEAETEK
ncbi:hypothetical protein TRFO_25154 [Tritrichomonas foetus]|uniref:Uncharacterized protein n=1 Tax=Tritrichomonas foetus TaxID=1144522 RepID=A0A1J4K5G2_9EUKA|nr:hypothetical protein TRFO_25154 [Tritrichomonas foetus]|eukprot:OHT06697.1 hypothetical protein TRFO_25154 [Tritrichomonas foetus]